MNNSVLIITEANETVATGHLYESAELAKHLIADGGKVVVMINDDAKPELKAKLPVFCEYNKNVEKGYAEISKVLKDGSYGVVVTDLREISNEWIQRFRESYDIPLICIDEWGHRRLDCDVIINPMIDPYFWKYEGTEAKLYCGHEYLILPSRLQEYRNKKKITHERIERICVSMGGVDRAGTTIKIFQWINNNSVKLRDLHWDIIIGAGFKRSSELRNILDEIERNADQDTPQITIHNAPDDIYEIFWGADLAFCAGGNTLHELACIGTPTIVIPSMPHEKRNGEAFESKGYGKCLCLSEDVTEELISGAFLEMSSFDKIYKMTKCGKLTVDGQGLDRTLRILNVINQGTGKI